MCCLASYTFVSLNRYGCRCVNRYEWLLKYCEDHAWMAAGTSAASAASSAVHTVPSVPTNTPEFTPPTSAGASTLTSTSVGADERAATSSTAVTLQARKLLPFSGSAELSDGSSVSLFAWLQRQLSALPEIGSDTILGARKGSSPPASAVASAGHAFVETASIEGKVEVKPAKEAGKKKLSTECAGKIHNLLAKGEGIFQWQSEKD